MTARKKSQAEQPEPEHIEEEDALTAAMRVLAVEKMLTTEMRAAKSAARQVATDEITPGERRMATLTDGTPIATITLTKPSIRGGWEITDPIALDLWCQEKGIDTGAKHVLTFPGWFTAQANLQAIIDQHGGEVPPGIADGAVETAPSLRVNQTQAQREALQRAVPTVDGLLAIMAPPEQIDAPAAGEEA